MAGKGIDQRPVIEHRLNDVDTKFEFFETKHLFHAYEIARDLDFTFFSSLVIVGGDGTISEAINGMIQRKDGRRLPVGFIPNGSSNDLCKSLGIKSIDYALDFILKRETLPIDTIRVKIDIEDEKEIS